MQNEDKRNIEGYVESFNIRLAGRLIVLAENPNVANTYLVCNIRWDNPLGFEECYDAVATGDYLEAMREFTSRVDRLITTLEDERSKSGLQVQALHTDDCIQAEYNTDWTDKLIIIKGDALSPEYRSAEHQLAACTGGFGAKPDSRGSTVSVSKLYNGKAYNYRRHQIAGVADISKIPEWARAKLAVLKEIKETHGVFSYGGYHFVPYRRFSKDEVSRRLKSDTRQSKTDAQYVFRNMCSDQELGLSRYDWAKSEYSYQQFYSASGNSSCDIFRCIENGKLYAPAANELFLYKEPPQRDKPRKNPSFKDKLNGAKSKAARNSDNNSPGHEPTKRDGAGLV